MRRPNMTFCMTVMCGKSAKSWKTVFTGRWKAGTPCIGRPRSSTSPSSGCSKPAIMRRVVVLPQPEGPSRAKNSPSAMSRLTPSTARTRWSALRSPNSFTSPEMRTAGAPAVAGAAGRVVAWSVKARPCPLLADEDPDLVPGLVQQRLALLVLNGEEEALARLGAGVDARVGGQLLVDEALVERGQVRRAVGGVVGDVGAHLRVEDVVDEHLGQGLVRGAARDREVVDPEVRALLGDDVAV